MKRRLKMEDGYISTGEAAKMLSVARSTVYRYFDQGILTGEQHPITKLCRIKRASVLALMKKYGMKWEEQA
jgi:excisionase family DNA binding protein